MKVDTKAFISITLNPGGINEVTVGDVKDWLAKVESFGYGDDTVVEECLLSLWIQNSNVTPISCSNHKIDEPEYNDILVGTHGC